MKTKNFNITSPARSQGAPDNLKQPRTRITRSLGSPSTSKAGRLFTNEDRFNDIDSFVVSPINRKSVLTDNTDIDIPKRASWWKKLDDNSQEVLQKLDSEKIMEVNNPLEEYINDDVLSQEQRLLSLEIPESSGSESISSIVIPQRKLFTQKENKSHKNFIKLASRQESLAKSKLEDKTIQITTKKLFNQGQQPKSKSIFPSNLLNSSPNKTTAHNETVKVAPKKLFSQETTKRRTFFPSDILNASSEKTISQETKVYPKNLLAQAEKRRKPIFPAALLSNSPNKTVTNKSGVEVQMQSRNLFGNRAGNNRKNMFANFHVTDSESEIPEIEARQVLKLKKRFEESKHGSSASIGLREFSPTSSITTDIELDDWKMLPSSTMMVDHIDDLGIHTPRKRLRLSILQKDTSPSNNMTIIDKTKQDFNKSIEKTKENKNNTHKSKENSFSSKSINNKTIEQTAQKSIHEGDAKAVNKSVENNKKYNNINKSINNVTSVQELGKNNSIDVSKEAEDVEEANDEELNLTYEHDDEKEFMQENGKVTSTSNNMTTRDKTKQDFNKSIEKTKGNSGSSKSIQNKSIDQTSQKSIVEGDEKAVNKSVKSIRNVSKGAEGLEKHDKDEELNLTYEHGDKKECMQENGKDDVIANNQKYESRKIQDKESEIEENEAESVLQDEISEVQLSVESVIELNEDHKSNNTSAVEQPESEEKQQFEDKKQDSVVEEEPKSKQQEFKEEIQQESKVETEKQHEEIGFENKPEEKQQESELEAEPEEEAEHAESEVENEPEEEQQEPEVEAEHEESEVEDQQESEEEAEPAESEVEDEPEEEAEHAGSEVENEPEEEQQESEVEAEHEESEVEDEPEEQQESEEEAEYVESEVEDEPEEERQESEVEAEHAESEVVDEPEEEQQESEVEAEHEDSEVDDEPEEIQQKDEQEEDQQESEVEVEKKLQDTELEDVANQSADDNDEVEREESNPEIDIEEDQNVNQEIKQSGKEMVEQNNLVQGKGLEHQTQQEINEDEINESRNITHDTTGRNRKKINKKLNSPEAIRQNITHENTSFQVKGRNTSVRNTILQPMEIRASLASVNSGSDMSAQGSGWDSHRTTRKTLRQTFGKDFTPRKSLRAMVMEQTAKRQTFGNDLAITLNKIPQANSTEIAYITEQNVDMDTDETDDDVSLRTRQTTLEMYLQKVKNETLAQKRSIERAVKDSLKAPRKDLVCQFNLPLKSYAPRRGLKSSNKENIPKSKVTKRANLLLGELPQELVKELKYKPPKRFMPSNASWATKRLYSFLEAKLEPKYSYKSRVRAERLVLSLHQVSQLLRRHDRAPGDVITDLKREMARLNIVDTHKDFYDFFYEFMPREIRIKVVPDIVNKIPIPKHGIHSAIISDHDRS